MKNDGIPTWFSAALPSPIAMGRVPSGRRLGVRVRGGMLQQTPATRMS
jgi:hypothetical protein